MLDVGCGPGRLTAALHRRGTTVLGLDVLAAVVLGGARLGGGRRTVLGCVLGVLGVAVAQNGLNLLGISPYAFKMIIGAIILVAITLSSEGAGRLIGSWRKPAVRRAA